MSPTLDRPRYVQRVLALYQLMPGTTGHIRPSDRHLARALYDRGVPFDIVSAALLLATARRTFRSGHPLPPIASLHYVRPVIDELLARSPDPAYITFICRKLALIAPTFAAAAAHQLP